VIAESMKELQKAKAGLEETVAKRSTGLKRANRELLQRNDQLEQYAFIAAHNLRAPVARLKGLIFLFKRLGGKKPKNWEIFEKISGSAIEMDEILTDMNTILEVENLAKERKQFVDLRHTLKRLQILLQEPLSEADAKVQINLQVKEVFANEAYLESILHNLLTNSIKYRALHRKLVLSVASWRDRAKVVIEVADNGIGIDIEKFGDKVFKLYQRLHEHSDGKGLGLYLVKSQVEAMAGKISIESKVDSGTTFRIILPE
jgi:signal transduction histidine kinase